jgi:hypothetical protein
MGGDKPRLGMIDEHRISGFMSYPGVIQTLLDTGVTHDSDFMEEVIYGQST